MASAAAPLSLAPARSTSQVGPTLPSHYVSRFAIRDSQATIAGAGGCSQPSQHPPPLGSCSAGGGAGEMCGRGWGRRLQLPRRELPFSREIFGRLARRLLHGPRDTAVGGVRARARPTAGGGGAGAQRPYTAVLIVPTGVGAAVGGYAGDALPVARAASTVADCLVTHPNVMNGAMLYWPLPNALYVEGHGLDRFAAGEWGLLPVHQNKVGLVLDCGMEEELLQRHLQAADAARATLGLSMPAYTLTERPLEVHKWLDPSTGASTGRIGSEEALLDAVGVLLEEHGCDAVAVVGRFPDDAEEELEAYRQGTGVDALAGVEAVISHLVVAHFGVPCAHAPALEPLPLLQSVAPRSAAEETGYTFLPCVLAGLSRAPRFVPRSAEDAAPGSPWAGARTGAGAYLAPSPSPSPFGASGALWRDDVDCVILPADAFGGAGTLAFSRMKQPPLFIAVQENSTVMEDPPSKFGIPSVPVANYWEALGVMAAHKAGVEPHALRAQGVPHIRRVEGKAKRNASSKPEEVLAVG